MDIQSEVENQKFLGVLGSPFKSMCKLCTLKAGVIILGILDVIIGILSTIGLIMIVFAFFSTENAHISFELVAIIFSGITSSAALFFALIGIRGMNKISPNDVSIYYRFKIIEFFLISVLSLIREIAENLRTGEDRLLGSLIFLLIFRAIALIFVKVVWSADIRLKYNETVLVMHGEDALKLMQQQANNLANPRVISPGMPIYVSPPFQRT